MLSALRFERYQILHLTEVNGVNLYCDREYSLGSLLSRAGGPLKADWKDIPGMPGIYEIVLPKGVELSVNSEPGSAMHALPATEEYLLEKWNRIQRSRPTSILYIGKGSNLRKRIRDLARFGLGLAANHHGGEWMWQVKEIRSAVVRIYGCPKGKEVAFEKWRLYHFFLEHGDWPFANRKGGDGIESWAP